jgi:hypothetical protein
MDVIGQSLGLEFVQLSDIFDDLGKDEDFAPSIAELAQRHKDSKKQDESSSDK